MKQFLSCGIMIVLLFQSCIASAHTQDVFFKEHALIFFFSSACPHCHDFAPVLKNYATGKGAHVLPLSIDNKLLAEFPESLPATTEWIMVAFKGEPIHYPALFIINPKTHALYPVSVGALDAHELTIRMAALIPKIKAYESQGLLS